MFSLPFHPVFDSLTLVLSTEAPELVVAIGGEVQPQPVLTANDGRGEVGTREPATQFIKHIIQTRQNNRCKKNRILKIAWGKTATEDF